MIDTQVYFDRETVEKIKEAAVLADIIPDFVQLTKKGSQQRGQCPSCGASKFEYSASKNVYKCWNGCEKGGNDAIQFLTDVIGKEYKEALAYLADRYHIQPNSQPSLNGKGTENRKARFRDLQLKASGIPDEYQRYTRRVNASTETIEDRYQAATIDKFWNVQAGDDMLLYYLDLQGNQMTYKRKGSTKQYPLFRIRWANPELHRNAKGKAMKYQSPYGSVSALWIPNHIIKCYRQKDILETLIVVEGEKKADALCLAGIPAVAVSGIHNFTADGGMPHEFELLINDCAVRNVVFLLDSDWQDLSIKPDVSVNTRPKTFYKAVLKFRNYFYGFISGGLNMRIYFAHGIDPVFKGIDDVIVRQVHGDGSIIKTDFEMALNAKEQQGVYVNAFDITESSSYALQKYWNLHSTPAFLEFYSEHLKDLPNFKIDKLLWRWDEKEHKFQLAQMILPHEEYWIESVVGEHQDGSPKKKYAYSYQGGLNFLYNRGYGLQEYQPHRYRFIHVDGKVVEETQPISIRHFMIDFTKEVGNKSVLEILLRGGKQYFGPDALTNLPRRNLPFQGSSRDCMYLYFKNVFWYITADKIEERPLNELPKYIWKDQIVDFEPKLNDSPLADLSPGKAGWSFNPGEDFAKSDIASYYLCTSNFYWKKSQVLQDDDKGGKYWAMKENPSPMTKEERQYVASSLAAKMLAAGYVLHDYLDYSCMKAIVPMDGHETAVGKSEGGTGKSIWAKAFEHLIPTLIIDGKKKNLEDDNHLYEEANERTRVIVYDDVRVNFSIEGLFSQITTGVLVNEKGQKRYRIDPPKFIIPTNHALNGEGNSYRRRQYVISFSDYFNGHRTPKDEFGHMMFYEWDNDQWNHFYNWMALCVQLYLRHGLVQTVQDDMAERRKLRQKIGEKFLSWADLVFDTSTDNNGNAKGTFLNKRIERKFLYNKYKEEDPKADRYLDLVKFKGKLKAYAKYAGLVFNPNDDPTRVGERIKSNNEEYFILASDKYEASMYNPGIKEQADITEWKHRHGAPDNWTEE